MTQIAIVVYPRFTALDFVGPYEVLRGLPGAEVRFVWHEPGPITSDSGVLTIGATHSFAETPAPDVVIVPGGPGCVAASRDEAVRQWLRTVAPAATWVASVCTGSIILAAAGLLEGARATTHWSSLPLLRTYGATPVDDERIVALPDRRLATAAGVSAGIDLALWLVGQIAGDKQAQAIQLMIEYDPQPPFDAGHRSKAPPSVVAASTALLSRDILHAPVMSEATKMAWERTIATVRGRRGRRASRR